jgi:hypothetical protein
MSKIAKFYRKSARKFRDSKYIRECGFVQILWFINLAISNEILKT